MTSLCINSRFLIIATFAENALCANMSNLFPKAALTLLEVYSKQCCVMWYT